MKNKVSLLFVYFSFILGFHAQDLSGLISDADNGDPLAGVNIVVQDQNQGAVSDVALCAASQVVQYDSFWYLNWVPPRWLITLIAGFSA